MKKVTNNTNRKTDHLKINLEENVFSGINTGLENIRFVHQALPELDLQDINLSTEIFGKTICAFEYSQ